MNHYVIKLEMDEATYRRLKKAEVKLKFKDSLNVCLFHSQRERLNIK